MAYTVAGQVVNENNQAAPTGTRICLGSGTGSSHTCQYGPQTVGTGGSFRFTGVAGGDYDVHIVKPNGVSCYNASPSPIRVDSNKVVRITAACL